MALLDLHVQSDPSKEGNVPLCNHVKGKSFTDGTIAGARTYENFAILQQFTYTALRLAAGEILEAHDSALDPLKAGSTRVSFRREDSGAGTDARGPVLMHKLLKPGVTPESSARALTARAQQLGFSNADAMGPATLADLEPTIVDVYGHDYTALCYQRTKGRKFFRSKHQHDWTRCSALHWGRTANRLHENTTDEQLENCRRQDGEISVLVTCRSGVTLFDVANLAFEQMGAVFLSGLLFVTPVPQDFIQQTTSILFNHLLHSSEFFRELPHHKLPHAKLLASEGQSLVWNILNMQGYRHPGPAGKFTTNPLGRYGLFPSFLSFAHIDVSVLAKLVSDLSFVLCPYCLSPLSFFLSSLVLCTLPFRLCLFSLVPKGPLSVVA
jgi:hypothetical protein